jgi:hypothetical protein
MDLERCGAVSRTVHTVYVLLLQRTNMQYSMRMSSNLGVV